DRQQHRDDAAKVPGSVHHGIVAQAACTRDRSVIGAWRVRVAAGLDDPVAQALPLRLVQQQHVVQARRPVLELVRQAAFALARLLPMLALAGLGLGLLAGRASRFLGGTLGLGAGGGAGGQLFRTRLGIGRDLALPDLTHAARAGIALDADFALLALAPVQRFGGGGGSQAGQA